MQIEQAIEYLSNKAETAITRAGTKEQNDKAERFADAVNTVIDFYNSEDENLAMLHRYKALMDIFKELLCIGNSDFEDILASDPDYIRERMMYRSEDFLKSPEYFWHWIAGDCVRKARESRDEEVRFTILRAKEWIKDNKPEGCENL